MNIFHIGAPNSGKTTVAARAFASLKETGLSVEFIPETARFHIAKKRYSLGRSWNQGLDLTGADQIEIFKHQAEAEWTLYKVCEPKTLIIADSWSLSAYLYMTWEDQYSANRLDDGLHWGRIREMTDPSKSIVFYCKPVPRSGAPDTNRIHSEWESSQIDQAIDRLLADRAHWLSPVVLEGDPDTRFKTALNTIRKAMEEHG